MVQTFYILFFMHRQKLGFDNLAQQNAKNIVKSMQKLMTNLVPVSLCGN